MAPAPRYLVRRSVAGAIDTAICWLVALILLFPAIGSRVPLPLPQAVTGRPLCTSVARLGPGLSDRFADRTVLGARACSFQFAWPSGAQRLTIATAPAGADAPVTLHTVVTDRAGGVSVPLDIAPLLILGLMMMFDALAQTFGCASRGKRVTGLRLRGTRRRALARDTLRLAPLLAWALWRLVWPCTGWPYGIGLASATLPLEGPLLAFAALWLLSPLVLPIAPWDRLAGTTVTRR